MKRAALYIATGALMLLTVASAALWLLSHRSALGLAGIVGPVRGVLVANDGGLAVVRVPLDYSGPDPGFLCEPVARWIAIGTTDENDFHTLGFRRVTIDDDQAIRFWVMPFWFLQIVSMVAAAWIVPRVILMRRNARREAAGHCRSCGYDLRATPDRCPECGRETARPTDGQTVTAAAPA